MKITEVQKDILLNFVKGNPDLASGKFSATFTKKKAEELWKTVADELNATVGPEKEWKAWRKTWQDMCIRTKQKSAANYKEMRVTSVPSRILISSKSSGGGMLFSMHKLCKTTQAFMIFPATSGL
ncbi:hypothetical protein Zmor_006084 [Zophobas morio]|uniref:Regulatory protein zeste n=1 Tax=Zophobas morio TaxID=2755281 RepID=A0AA38IR36_9CUCU|nr:hypothetical protein Zmor_006084 [Zophobas morio]